MKSNNKLGLKGKYRFHRYRALPRWVPHFVSRWLYAHGFMEHRKIASSPWIENLIVNSENRGINLVLRRMIGQKQHDIEITSAEIGTDDTATTEADTELGEVVLANIPRATQEIDGKTAIITFFIPDMDLPEDEYHEFGLRAGSQFFARSIISPSYEKSEAEDILVEYHISLDNVE